MTTQELERKVEKLHETAQVQKELIELLYSQVVDLSMMSKIELGDDVITELKRLKEKLKENE